MSKKHHVIRASHLAKFVKPFRYTWTHYRCEKEWNKLQRQENKYFAIFNTKTLALYFSHGKIREEEAWNALMQHPVIEKDKAIRESKRSQAYNIYEKAYAMRDPELLDKAYHFTGNTGVEAEEFKFTPYNLKAKPDGLMGDYVIEIKCPLGSLPKDIAVNYLLQLAVEMACHNRRKAYFFQYYQPAGWYNFFGYLHQQYFQEPQVNDVVFRPWFDNDYMMFVIYQRVEKTLRSLEGSYLGSTNSRVRNLVDLFWDYCYQEEKLPKPEGKESWEDNRAAAIHLVANISSKKLINHGFTNYESRCIIDAISMEGNDMKMGRVLSVTTDGMHVMWEGDRIRNDEMQKVIDNNTGAFKEYIDFKRFRRGILKIIKRMNHQISGRPEDLWMTWQQDLRQDRLTDLPPMPEVQSSLHEVTVDDKDFTILMASLQCFLMDLKENKYPFKKNRSGTQSGDFLVTVLKEVMNRRIVENTSHFDTIYNKIMNHY